MLDTCVCLFMLEMNSFNGEFLSHTGYNVALESHLLNSHILLLNYFKLLDLFPTIISYFNNNIRP